MSVCVAIIACAATRVRAVENSKTHETKKERIPLACCVMYCMVPANHSCRTHGAAVTTNDNKHE